MVSTSWSTRSPSVCLIPEPQRGAQKREASSGSSKRLVSASRLCCPRSSRAAWRAALPSAWALGAETWVQICADFRVRHDPPGGCREGPCSKPSSPGTYPLTPATDLAPRRSIFMSIEATAEQRSTRHIIAEGWEAEEGISRCPWKMESVRPAERGRGLFPARLQCLGLPRRIKNRGVVTSRQVTAG